jgi:hypothetical protein
MPSKIPSAEHLFYLYNSYQLSIHRYAKGFVRENTDRLQVGQDILQKYYKYAHIPDVWFPIDGRSAIFITRIIQFAFKVKNNG